MIFGRPSYPYRATLQQQADYNLFLSSTSTNNIVCRNLPENLLQHFQDFSSEVYQVTAVVGSAIMLNNYVPKVQIKAENPSGGCAVRTMDGNSIPYVYELLQEAGSVTSIIFASAFNKKIPRLPASLLHLHIGDNFQFALDNLPKGLENLHIGETEGARFNQPLELLPHSLHELKIRGNFAHSLDSLPQSLERLELQYYNFPLNHLPSDLGFLKLGAAYSHPLVDLPSNIHTIFCRYNNAAILDVEFPPSLTHLHVTEMNLNVARARVPESITSLTIYESFSGIFEPEGFGNLKEVTFINSQVPDFKNPLANLSTAHFINNLPQTLTLLTLPPWFNAPIHLLPPQMEFIQFGPRFNKDINTLPDSIKSIIFDGSVIPAQFNRIISRLPVALVSLRFPGRSLFAQPLPHLPPMFKILEVPKGLDLSQVPKDVVVMCL